MPTPAIPGIDSLRNEAGAIPSTKYSFHAAEIYLVLILLVFGLSACFLLPVSGG